MEFRRIIYFLKVAECLSFSEAAMQLYISPQALTKQIALLEQELALKLFERTTRKVSLTDAGHLCHEQFLRLQKEYSRTEAEIQKIAQKEQHTLRVGFFRGLPKNEIITPWVSFIQGLCPKEHIEMIAGDLDPISLMIEDGKLDIAITNTHIWEYLNDCHCIPLLSCDAKIVVSLLHPWVIKDHITLDDIKQASMIQMKRSKKHHPKSFYGKVHCKEIHYVPDFDTLLATLETGTEFAVFPPIFEFKERGKYKYFDLPKEANFEFQTICVSRHDTQKSKVSEIMKSIQEDFHL